MGDCVLPAFIGQKSRRRDHETSRLDMRQPTPAPLSPHLPRQGTRSQPRRKQWRLLVDKDARPHPCGGHGPLTA